MLNSGNEVNENSMVRVNTTSEMESFQEIVEKCEIRGTQSTKRMTVIQKNDGKVSGGKTLNTPDQIEQWANLYESKHEEPKDEFISFEELKIFDNPQTQPNQDLFDHDQYQIN